MIDEDKAEPTTNEILVEIFREVRAIRRFLYGMTAVALIGYSLLVLSLASGD